MMRGLVVAGPRSPGGCSPELWTTYHGLGWHCSRGGLLGWVNGGW